MAKTMVLLRLFQRRQFHARLHFHYRGLIHIAPKKQCPYPCIFQKFELFSETASQKQDHHSSTSHEHETKSPHQYLHVGPSGDCWISESKIFGAKHLQPDYVRTIPMLLHKNNNNKSDGPVCTETLLELLETNPKLTQEIYDTGKIPQRVLQQAKTNDNHQE